ncbi:hypothetical protein RBE51_19415 [Pseudomonas taiwanensis]|uniref:hypothetical protein n=1 Tax=Pseudomonas taiwanensis TaxID=470150 RepID=UPI0028E06BB5|nr:hypothetical protein [Pseudomonas taiwanensis]MDT8924960.1 hypothetical protein [Pseudomonas taiwanensis]
MLLHTVFEWVGAATGIAGAAMVASHSKYSPYGWISFLVSSSCMSVFAVMTQAWGLLLLESCFILTNLLGLWRGLIQPFVRNNSSRHGEEATPPEPAPSTEL